MSSTIKYIKIELDLRWCATWIGANEMKHFPSHCSGDISEDGVLPSLVIFSVNTYKSLNLTYLTVKMKSVMPVFHAFILYLYTYMSL